jgi:hypothetical protein
MGVVGGLMPSPLHLISLTQIALHRWVRAVFILLVPPLAVDAILLLVTFFFFRYIPANITHYIAYAGGALLLGFASFTLFELRRKNREQMAESAVLTYASVSVATLTELTAPGTWVYWLTIAGPIIQEGRNRGYWHVAPFFAGSLLGYYGAALVSLWLMAWGPNLHQQFKKHLVLIANVLLLITGISYLLRAYLGR